MKTLEVGILLVCEKNLELETWPFEQVVVDNRAIFLILRVAFPTNYDAKRLLSLDSRTILVYFVHVDVRSRKLLYSSLSIWSFFIFRSLKVYLPLQFSSFSRVVSKLDYKIFRLDYLIIRLLNINWIIFN